ncbi:hypothetical protein HYDPIDRAFT_107106 [Hydnomerulius pinastri MD-312]|nr:hypothetical protein HYDPIDRAFT_107106 [Hydnomerulius pinastri MD-312]
MTHFGLLLVPIVVALIFALFRSRGSRASVVCGSVFPLDKNPQPSRKSLLPLYNPVFTGKRSSRRSLHSMPSLRAPYVCISAFTGSTFGGNPAMIVAVPPGKIADGTYDAEFMTKIALNFFMPILVFVSPPDPNDPNVKDDERDIFDVRFFAGTYSPIICGHGMFATTKAICSKLLPTLNWDPSTRVVRFRTGAGTLVSSRMVPGPNPSADAYEIDLPANTLVEVDAVERLRIATVVASATGKSLEELGIEYVAYGGGAMGKYVVIVFKEGTELEGMEVDVPVLAGTAPFVSNILTTLTPNKPTTFVSRMFAPLNGISEDQVTGSAHTMLVPYWSARLGKPDGEEMYARQVSRRGGDLWVRWEKNPGKVVIKSRAVYFAKGELEI